VEEEEEEEEEEGGEEDGQTKGRQRVDWSYCLSGVVARGGADRGDIAERRRSSGGWRMSEDER